MSFEPEFLELMPHVIQVYSFVSVDAEGEATYDPDPATQPGKRYQCRIVGKGLALRTKFSEQDTVIYDIYVGPRLIDNEPDFSTMGDVFRIEDKIVLPADQVYTDQTPLIFAVGRFPDDEGHHHTKIQCGFMYHRQGQ